jgi:hypothetical protein
MPLRYFGEGGVTVYGCTIEIVVNIRSRVHDSEWEQRNSQDQGGGTQGAQSRYHIRGGQHTIVGRGNYTGVLLLAQMRAHD